MNLTTFDDGLTTFPAPGPFRAPGEPIPARVTGAPLVCLVDIHGAPVPDHERYTPTCPPDPEDPRDWGPEWDNWYFGPTDPADCVPLDGLDLPPISGGAPEPFEPTAEDLADYAQWAAELEARRDQDAFYRLHPLAEFNALRTD